MYYSGIMNGLLYGVTDRKKLIKLVGDIVENNKRRFGYCISSVSELGAMEFEIKGEFGKLEIEEFMCEITKINNGAGGHITYWSDQIGEAGTFWITRDHCQYEEAEIKWNIPSNPIFGQVKELVQSDRLYQLS